MSHLKVSVIMPAFNSAPHIAKAIESVLAQTERSFELIIIDGGSQDGTLGVVARYSDSDARVRCLTNPNDKGPAHARCNGIRASQGEYIAFLDADDLWLPAKLQAQVHYMEDARIPFSYTLYRQISENGDRTSCIVPMRAEYDFERALRSRGMGTLTIMVRKELLSEDVITQWKRAGGEEYLWWLLVLRKGIVARLLPRDLARYRDTASSLSKNQLYTLRSVWHMYRHEIGLSHLGAVSRYFMYLYDSTLRRLRLLLCAAFGRKTATEG
jgi:teichuronic acid biosynthesis glycosyltransferase TuaG